MRLKKLFIYVLLGMSFFYGLSSKAVTIGRQKSEYLGGMEMCTLAKNDYLAKEFGHFVSVPVIYSDDSESREGVTSIYYWTRSKFNPELPTVVYINGGPGSSSHESSFVELSDFNIVYFDQRGVACSKGKDLALQNKTQFYSIESIARDLEFIRQDLNISQWTVYGHSFGTTIATVYASLFPLRTRALILEGTIFLADSTVWLPEHRLKIMQKYFDSLPENLQNYILEKSKIEKQESFFESSLRSFMYGNEFRRSFGEYLKYMYDYDNKEATQRNDKLNSKNYSRSSFLHNETAWGMMACKYLSALDPLSSLKFIFENRKLVAKVDMELFTYRKKQCNEAGVKSLLETQVYRAVNYPVSIPTTYFHGANDGATSFPQPSYHYKETAKGSRQILIMPEGGHSPLLNQILVSDFDENKVTDQDKILAGLQAQIFKKAALGQKIEKDDLKAFNAKSSLKWKLHNKFF